MVIFSLTLVRHGETTHNKEKIIQGQMDVPLSAEGENQVERLGISLQNQKFTHIFSSDLKRAKRTAEIIVKNNLHFKGSIIDDPRLRERKFGEVEGKSFKYLKEISARVDLRKFTPPGAESADQVRERTLDFFQELCKNLKTYTPEACDGSSNINQDYSEDLDDNFNNQDTRQGKRKRLSSSIDFKEEVHIEPETQSETNSTTYHPSSNCSLNPESQTDEQKNCHFKENFIDPAAGLPLSSKPCSSGPISCPAMALTPLVDQLFTKREYSERRLSICSSNDEFDATPLPVATILVVGHGGSLRELIKHFVEELNCFVPGGKRQALRTSPNSGLSKFTFTLEEEDEIPKIICHQIHDKQHLELAQKYRNIPADYVYEK